MHLLPSCWETEDLDFIQQGLAKTYPDMAPGLRRAIILLSMDEVRPREGRDALRQRALSFARHCPASCGLDQLLAS